jgi:hypothetical protein
VAEIVEDLEGRFLVHACAEVRPGDVVEVDPIEGEAEEVVSVCGMQEVGAVELFVIGAVAALDTSVVALATDGIAA